jgi:hypothetical protein
MGFTYCCFFFLLYLFLYCLVLLYIYFASPFLSKLTSKYICCYHYYSKVFYTQLLIFLCISSKWLFSFVTLDDPLLESMALFDRYKLTFFAMNETVEAQLFHFDSIAKCIVGKPGEVVLR